MWTMDQQDSIYVGSKKDEFGGEVRTGGAAERVRWDAEDVATSSETFREPARLYRRSDRRTDESSDSIDSRSLVQHVPVVRTTTNQELFRI